MITGNIMWKSCARRFAGWDINSCMKAACADLDLNTPDEEVNRFSNIVERYEQRIK